MLIGVAWCGMVWYSDLLQSLSYGLLGCGVMWCGLEYYSFVWTMWCRFVGSCGWLGVVGWVSLACLVRYGDI